MYDVFFSLFLFLSFPIRFFGFGSLGLALWVWLFGFGSLGLSLWVRFFGLGSLGLALLVWLLVLFSIDVEAVVVVGGAVLEEAAGRGAAVGRNAVGVDKE